MFNVLNCIYNIYIFFLDNLLKSAKSEHQNRNFISTQKICKELLTHTPTDLNVILLNAESFFNCGNYEKCIDCLEIANNINPNCSEVLSNFALVYMKKSENDLAKEYLFKVCTLKPFCVEAWTNYANFLFKTNDLITADLAYVRVLSIKPELYKVRNEYGKLLLKLNRIKEAKKHFKISNNCATECPDTLNNLADVYYKCGKFEKSILRYKQVLEIDPDKSNIYFHLGKAYLKIKEYQNALNAFTQAMAQEPENVCFLKNLAVTYCLLDNMALCAEMYKKCLTLIPEDYNLNLDLALVYLLNIKDYQEAAKYLKKCIQLHPNGINLLDLYTKLFQAYRKSDDHLNASDVCMIIGDLYLEKDDQENAKTAFFTAAIMNPGNAFGHWKLGLTIIHDLDLALQR